MTVGELIELLDEYNEDDTIVAQDSNSIYCSSFECILEDKGVRAFYGNDYRALVLRLGSQEGAVWDADELGIDDDESEDDDDE